MEMPCPCQRCGEWFDLHDGHSSEKWYSNTVICEECYREEEKEIERDKEIEELKNTIEDAEITIGDAQTEIEEAKKRLKEMGINYDKLES